MYNVCHSVCIFWTYYSMLKPRFSMFRIITVFLGCPIFFVFLQNSPEQVNSGSDHVPLGRHLISTGPIEWYLSRHLYFIVPPTKLDPPTSSACCNIGVSIQPIKRKLMFYKKKKKKKKKLIYHFAFVYTLSECMNDNTMF